MRYNVTVKTEEGWTRVYPDKRRIKPYLWDQNGRATFGPKQKNRAVRALQKRFGAKKVRAVEVENNPLNLLQTKHNLVMSSKEPATPGVHSPTSFHYQKPKWGICKARDWGAGANGVVKLRKAAADVRAKTPIGGVVPKYHGHEVRELFGPFPWYIKNGVVYEGQFPDHGDHLHGAFD